MKLSYEQRFALALEGFGRKYPKSRVKLSAERDMFSYGILVTAKAYGNKITKRLPAEFPDKALLAFFPLFRRLDNPLYGSAAKAFRLRLAAQKQKFSLA